MKPATLNPDVASQEDAGSTSVRENAYGHFMRVKLSAVNWSSCLQAGQVRKDRLPTDMRNGGGDNDVRARTGSLGDQWRDGESGPKPPRTADKYVRCQRSSSLLILCLVCTISCRNCFLKNQFFSKKYGTQRHPRYAIISLGNPIAAVLVNGESYWNMVAHSFLVFCASSHTLKK